MSCFSRFVREYYKLNGCYGFGCAWWSFRQLNGSIFRLGTLEFEFLHEKNERTVSIHIPSDVHLKVSEIIDSIKRCRAFIKMHKAQFINAKIVCQTWLLSPSITPLLKETSNILHFQQLFEITKINEDANDFYRFLFLTSPDTPIELLKEESSLQRKVKTLLQNSIKIGDAYGVLKKDFDGF